MIVSYQVLLAMTESLQLQDFKLIMSILNGMSSSAKASNTTTPVEEAQPVSTPAPLESPKKSEIVSVVLTQLTGLVQI